MQRAGVLRVCGQHGLQRAQDGGRVRPRLPVRQPVVPRGGIHQGVGVERGGAQVFRVGGGDLRHRVRVGAVEGRPIGLRVVAVAGGEGLDQRLFHGRSLALEAQRALRAVPGRCDGFGLHRQVEVGAERQRLAPPGHRVVGIQACGFPERPHGLGMVEGVDEVHALGEERLGVRVLRRRDRVVQLAEAGEPGGERRGGSGGVAVQGAGVPELGGRGQGREQGTGKGERAEHDGAHVTHSFMLLSRLKALLQALLLLVFRLPLRIGHAVDPFPG